MSLRGEFVKLISLKSLSGEPVESRIKSGMTKQRKKSIKTVEYRLILVYARRLLAGIIYITVRQAF